MQIGMGYPKMLASVCINLGISVETYSKRGNNLKIDVECNKVCTCLLKDYLFKKKSLQLFFTLKFHAAVRLRLSDFSDKWVRVEGR
jgi:hypothetical protein